jgi:hypothetical protein
VHGLIINQHRAALTRGCLHGADALFDSEGAAMLPLEQNSFINIFMDTAGESVDSYYKERESRRAADSFIKQSL